MTIRINNLSLALEDDINLLKEKAAKKLNISTKDIENFKILRESIDARKKDNIKFNYSVELSCKKEERLVNRCKNKDISFLEEEVHEDLVMGNKRLSHKPIIVGMGPAGIFAGLLWQGKAIIL